MDEKWLKPSSLKYIPPRNNYIISIDESGSCSYSKKIYDLIKSNNVSEIDENRRYFTLCAVIFTKENYRKACIDIENLKFKYWTDGMYEYKNKGIQKVCFHTADINHKRGCFSPEVINFESFVKDLSCVLEEIECTIIAVTLDLLVCVQEGHINDIYSMAFKMVLERYIYFAPNNSSASIILESRGKKEDEELLTEIRPTFFSNGIKNISPNELTTKISGVYFNHKWRDEQHTYIGLEIADLFAYPIYKYEQTGIERKDFNILVKKIYGYPHRIKFGLMNNKK